MTLVQAIEEIFANEEGVVTSRQVIDWIYSRHPGKPWKETAIRTYLIGLSVNHPSNDHYPYLMKRAFLYRVGRGRYQKNPTPDHTWVLTSRAIKPNKFYTPSMPEIEAAHEVFQKKEPRDLFYRVAIELIDLAIRGDTSLSVGEALAVLLQTWNKVFYRYHKFDSQHFSEIEYLVNSHRQLLTALRQRSIESLSADDETPTKTLFTDFKKTLGPVGAAKSLHLWAPLFFPLWDRAIAKAYGLYLSVQGKDAELYWQFMEISRQQCNNLGGAQTLERNPLKAMDEYNYCKYTKRWI